MDVIKWQIFTDTDEIIKGVADTYTNALKDIERRIEEMDLTTGDISAILIL